ncbi:hypothetical protein NL676_032958 [Syzygium grande]|nr:hypothetical protein NL676_032958 [Syzygium grande]
MASPRLAASTPTTLPAAATGSSSTTGALRRRWYDTNQILPDESVIGGGGSVYNLLHIFTYYTPFGPSYCLLWIAITSSTSTFYLRNTAIFTPVFAGMALLCFLCVFIGFVMLKSKKKNA